MTEEFSKPLLFAFKLSFQEVVLQKCLAKPNYSTKKSAVAQVFHNTNSNANQEYEDMLKLMSVAELSALNIDPVRYYFECYLFYLYLKSNGARSVKSNYKIIKLKAEPVHGFRVGNSIEMRNEKLQAYLDPAIFNNNDNYFLAPNRILYVISDGNLVPIWRLIGYNSRPFFKDNNTLNYQQTNLVKAPLDCVVLANNTVRGRSGNIYRVADYDGNYERMFRIIERDENSEQQICKRRHWEREEVSIGFVPPLLDASREHYLDNVVGRVIIRQDELVFEQLLIHVNNTKRLLSQCVIPYDGLVSHALYLDGNPHNLRRENLVIAPLGVYWNAERRVVYYYEPHGTQRKCKLAGKGEFMHDAIRYAAAALHSFIAPQYPQGALPLMNSTGCATLVKKVDGEFQYYHKSTGQLTTTTISTEAERDKLYGNSFIVHQDVGLVEIILSARDSHMQSILIDIEKLGTQVHRHFWRIENNTITNEEGVEITQFLYGEAKTKFYFADGNCLNLTQFNVAKRSAGIYWEAQRQRLKYNVNGTTHNIMLQEEDLPLQAAIDRLRATIAENQATQI